MFVYIHTSQSSARNRKSDTGKMVENDEHGNGIFVVVVVAVVGLCIVQNFIFELGWVGSIIKITHT